MNEKVIHSLENMKPFVEELLHGLDIWFEKQQQAGNTDLYHELTMLFMQFPTPHTIEELITKLESYTLEKEKTR